MTSNKFFRAVAFVTLVSNVFVPLAAGAQTVAPSALRRPVEKVVASRDAKFCASLQTHQMDVGGRIDDRQAKLAEVRTERDARIAQRRTEQDSKVDALRQEQVTKRAEQYAKLDGVATTDAQKAAVSAFKTAAEAAIAARNTAVDAAMTAFQTGVDKAITDRKTKVDSWASVFESSMKTAMDKAKADCEAGADPATIRAALKTATTAARTKMQADRKAIDAIGQTVKALAETRRTAVETAHAEFQKSMEKARTALKAALKPDEKPVKALDSNPADGS